MIDHHCGHLARDGREHAIRLLDAFTGQNGGDVHEVDVAWTLKQRAVVRAESVTGGRAGKSGEAALLVVERRGGYGGLTDTVVDLRVDDHDRPMQELARLYELHRTRGVTPTPAALRRRRCP
jgi:uncharacterized Ntn-hydrolase superfamily protein